MDTSLEVFFGVWVPDSFTEAHEDWEDVIEEWTGNTWLPGRPAGKAEVVHTNGLSISQNMGVFSVTAGIMDTYTLGLAVAVYQMGCEGDVEWLQTPLPELGITPDRVKKFQQQLRELGILDKPGWKIAAYTC